MRQEDEESDEEDEEDEAWCNTSYMAAMAEVVNQLKNNINGVALLLVAVTSYEIER